MEAVRHQRHVTFDAAKDLHSPRFRAIIRATSGRRKRHYSIDVKSFSHEMNSKGMQQHLFRKLHGLGSSQDLMAAIQGRFKRLKEEVDIELGIFAGELVGLLENKSGDQPDWSKRIEDLLILARLCDEMSPDDFRDKCEGIVQDLDDSRQELPAGSLKQIHTRMLFILTRCTRLLQFQKEGVAPDNDHGLVLHQFSDLGAYPGHVDVGLPGLKRLSSIKKVATCDNISFSPGEDATKSSDSSPSSSRDRISSWKKFPSAAEKNLKKDIDDIENVFSIAMLDTVLFKDNDKKEPADCNVAFIDSEHRPTDSATRTGKPYPDEFDDHVVDGDLVMICRICDLKIPKVHVEEHSRICTIADRCDFKGLTINERLDRVAEILEKILESCTPKHSDHMGVNQEIARVSISCITEEFDEMSCDQNILSHPTSTEPIECLPEAINSFVMRELNILPPMSCKTHCLPSADPVTVASSSGSMTPQSQLSTPSAAQIDLLLTGHNAFSELEDLGQIHELLDIVHCIENTEDEKLCDYDALDYLQTCLEDLLDVIEDKKVDALIVETFGRRIEKLLQEKYAHILRQIDDGKLDAPCITADEDGSAEMDSVPSSRTSPNSSKLKDRTTIEDFEIIKPISRGAFGRVFLAKKRVTGDFFAIKVLKKADMIRKNAVESILAERNILISVRNPFVVRFFYSFTCRENLYLVMEYLNGGDLYSLLRNLGCLDEDMARTYIAEVVLALEYLHSMNVIHRDLKPDNLLIAHDGHMKLTDFGLSRVGLINSTDDLSGPDVSGSALLDGHVQEVSKAQRMQKRQERQKQCVVGTPDYLAPEILLGTAHGPTADWWSVGIIMFELLVGIPPFNAEHPQKIFDNIMNRDIPWPQVPEEMSFEAYDLIDKLLIENPGQRLGATGASEVKCHPFFKNSNWEMLAKQKAAFVPSTEGDHDTSYFKCRHTWESGDVRISTTPNECDYMSETCSMSCSSSTYGYEHDEEGDQCNNLADFGTTSYTSSYSFSNFSFKNLSQLASINCEMVNKENKDSRQPLNAQLY